MSADSGPRGDGNDHCSAFYSPGLVRAQVRRCDPQSANPTGSGTQPAPHRPVNLVDLARKSLRAAFEYLQSVLLGLLPACVSSALRP